MMSKTQIWVPFLKINFANVALIGKELYNRFTVRVLGTFLNLCGCASFPFGFEGGMWDLINS